MKPRAFIIYGPIGCGKTRRALELAERAKQGGYRVLGLASVRVVKGGETIGYTCLLYTSPSPRDRTRSRMPSSA